MCELMCKLSVCSVRCILQMAGKVLGWCSLIGVPYRSQLQHPAPQFMHQVVAGKGHELCCWVLQLTGWVLRWC